MGISNELKNDIITAIQSTGATLYDIEVTNENGYDYLRVYIKAKDGVNLALCEEVSRLVSPLIDVHEPLRGKYFFEVSSPGIERTLRSSTHFENSLGESVKLTLVDKRKLNGKILAFDTESDTLHIEVEGAPVMIPLSEISKARTYFEWS